MNPIQASTERSNRIVAVSQPEPSEPPRHAAEADDIDLGRYAFLLWRYRYVILAATLVSGAAAAAITLSSKRLYEASAILSLTSSKLAESNSTVGTANFRPIVLNRAVAQKIVEQFHLDQEPYKYNGASFLEYATQLDEIRNTSLMRVAVRLRDPALAANVTNALSNAAVDFSQSIAQGDGIRARDMMKVELDRASARLQSASAALAVFERSAQLDLAKADLEGIVRQREEMPALVAKVEGLKAMAAQSEKEVANRQKADAATRNAGASGAADKSEESNYSYERLDRAAGENRAELARLERELQSQAGLRNSDATTIAKLRDYRQKQAEHDRLDLEKKLAEKTYSEVVGRYEGARLQVAARSAQLQVIDAAVVPSRPISRQVVSTTFTALVGGFFLSAVCALAFGLSRERLTSASR